jgi:biopolymer transport protein ExbB/TolQ
VHPPTADGDSRNREEQKKGKKRESKPKRGKKEIEHTHTGSEGRLDARLHRGNSAIHTAARAAPHRSEAL